jgi:hypothetical protein
VTVGTVDLLGETEGLGVTGLEAFTIFQTNFVPLFTHLKCALPDFVNAPTLEQTDPCLTDPYEAETAMGANMTAMAKTEAEIISGEFLREVFMEKRYSQPSASTSTSAKSSVNSPVVLLQMNFLTLSLVVSI